MQKQNQTLCMQVWPKGTSNPKVLLRLEKIYVYEDGRGPSWRVRDSANNP